MLAPGTRTRKNTARNEGTRPGTARNRTTIRARNNQTAQVGPEPEAQLRKSFSDREARGRAGAREEDPSGSLPGACDQERAGFMDLLNLLSWPCRSSRRAKKKRSWPKCNCFSFQKQKNGHMLLLQEKEKEK